MFSHFFDQKRENNRKTVDNWVWGQQGKSMTLLYLFDNFITKPFFLSSESTTRSDGVIFPQLHNILMSFASLVSFGGASTLTIQLVLTKSAGTQWQFSLRLGPYSLTYWDHKEHTQILANLIDFV